MENNIIVNMENLTNEEREQLLKLVKKSNKTTKKRWRAKIDEVYYYISSVGKIDSTTEVDHSFDEGAYKFGNYFKTNEEAEFELNKRLVYQELKDYALEHNKVKLNWKDSLQDKWCICYDFHNKILSPENWHTIGEIGQIYFSSQQIALDAITAVGEDRIEKYLFGVE